MKINSAFYLDGAEAKVVTLEEINKELYEEKYRNRLFCGVNGCQAEIIYVERKQHGITSYFKTSPGSIHLSNCINDVKREKGRRSRRSSIVEPVSLTAKHIMQALKDTAAVAAGKRNKRNPNKRSNTKSNIVDNQRDTYENNVGIASLNVTQNSSENTKKREPPLLKVDVAQLSDIHIGNSYSIYGNFGSFTIAENECELCYENTNGIMVYGYIGNQYREQSSQAFSLLPNIEEYIKIGEYTNPLKLCCAGLVEKNEDAYKIILYSEPSFLIDGKDIFSITAFLKNRKQN